MPINKEISVWDDECWRLAAAALSFALGVKQSKGAEQSKGGYWILATSDWILAAVALSFALSASKGSEAYRRVDIDA